ncbi:FecR domain-containing protein [Verrucomicrobiaceae bacterium R5-34]|nr:FecR domain-containing protein [Verrucomicrobiaceae bacterium R5-34]
MKKRDLEQLIQKMVDGEATADEIAQLGTELKGCAASREFYRRSMRVELLLHEALQCQVLPATPELRERLELPSLRAGDKSRSRRQLMLHSAMAAAALLLLSFVAMHWFSRAGKEAGVPVTFSPGTSWSGSMEQASRMKFGDSLTIEFGVARIELPGVLAIIEGPAEVNLTGPGLLELREGKGWFRVSEAGQGFRVLTPSVEVVDHGTEFGLVADPNDADEVHVFDGRVHCSARFALKEGQDLREGAALRVSPVGRWIDTELSEQRFLTSLPSDLPGIHFSFDGPQPMTPEGSYPAVENMQAATRGGGGGTFTRGVRGKALSVQDPEDAVRTDWPGIGGAKPRTIACWIRPDAAHGVQLAGIVSWGTPSTRPSGRCQIMTSKSRKTGQRVLRFSLGHSMHFSGTTELAAGEWHHVAAVFRGTETTHGEMIELYIDGKREQVDRELSNLPRDDQAIRTVIKHPNSQPLQIGCGAYDNASPAPFYGEIDEVWILPRALTAAEIKGLMAVDQ